MAYLWPMHILRHRNCLFIALLYLWPIAYIWPMAHFQTTAYVLPMVSHCRLPIACLWPSVYRQIQPGVLLLNPSWTSQWGAPYWLGGLCQGCKQGAGKYALCMQHTMPHISRLMQHSCSMHAYMHATSNTGSMHKTCNACNMHANVRALFMHLSHTVCTLHATTHATWMQYNCGRGHIPNTPNTACT